MRTRKEIESEIKVAREEYNKAVDSLTVTHEKDLKRLENELEAIESKFVAWVKKQFGKLKVCVMCSKYGLKVCIAEDNEAVDLLVLDYEMFLFNTAVPQELAEEIRNKFIETYGLPKEGDCTSGTPNTISSAW